MVPFLLAAAVKGSNKYIITIGTSAASAGWDNSGTTFGSISPDNGSGIEMPNDPGFFINAIRTVTTGGSDLTVTCDTAGRAQTAWTTLYIMDGTNVLRKYNSADALFSDATQTSWAFGDGTNDVWALADSGEKKLIVLI